ncbi:MAG: lysostaphin resistance A-like protein, partial [Bacteroidota bacterium]
MKSNFMEELIKIKKGAPVWLQLSFLLIWISGVALLSCLGGDTSVDDARLSGIMTPGLIRFMIVVQAVIVFFLPIIFFIFLLRQSGFPFLTLGKKPKFSWLLFGVFCMASSFPFVSWIGEINSEMHLPSVFSGMEKWMRSMETQSSKTSEILLNDKSFIGLILNLFTIAFTAAFSEELFFRATLQRTLTETRLNYHVGIWITAIIFSAIHMQFFGFFPRLFLGAVLGYLFYYTENIWVSIIAHFLNNGFVVVLGYLSSTDVHLNPLEKGKEDLDISFGWPLAILSFLVVLSL